MSLLAAKPAVYSGKKYLLGKVRSATLLPENVSPFRNLGEPKRGAKRRGILYERKVFRALSEAYGNLRVHPWFRYDTPNDSAYCQPDAILFNDVDIWLFEVKYSHCLDAYWQMTNYYRPVVELAFGRRPVRRIEVVHDFYSELPFPEPIRFSMDLQEFQSRNTDYGVVEVLRWKP